MRFICRFGVRHEPRDTNNRKTFVLLTDERCLEPKELQYYDSGGEWAQMHKGLTKDTKKDNSRQDGDMMQADR